MKYEKAYQNQRYVPLSPVVFSIEDKSHFLNIYDAKVGIARQIVADDRRIVANGLQIVAKRSKETPTIKSLLGTIFTYAKNKYYALLLVDGLLAIMYKFTDCCHLCYKNIVGWSLIEIQ